MEVVGDNKSESYDPAKEEKAPVMIKEPDLKDLTKSLVVKKVEE